MKLGLKKDVADEIELPPCPVFAWGTFFIELRGKSNLYLREGETEE